MDRRNQENEGRVAKQGHEGKMYLDGDLPLTMEEDMGRYEPMRDKEFDLGAGVVRKKRMPVRSFDDGGVVDDGYEEPVDESNYDTSQVAPAMLAAQQADALLSAGFDKTLEQALGVNDVGSLDQPAVSDDNLTTGGVADPALPVPQQPRPPAARPPTLENRADERIKGVVKGAWEGIKRGVSGLAGLDPFSDAPQSPLQDAGKGEGVIQEGMPEDDTMAPPVTAPVTGAPQPAGAGDYDEYNNSGENLGKSPGVRERGPASTRNDTPAKKGYNEDDDPEMQKYNKYLRIATRMFPWASQGQQRDAYIARRMHDEEVQSGKERIEGVKSTTKEANTTATNQSHERIAADKNANSAAGRALANMTKLQIANANNFTRTLNNQLQLEVRKRGQDMMNPDFAGSNEYKALEERLVKELRKSPQEIQQLIAASTQMDAGQAPAHGPAPQVVSGQRRIDPNTGQAYVKSQADGKWYKTGTQ